MKHLAGLALAVVVVATPLYAQRGGGGGGARGGGFSGHSSPAMRSSAPAFHGSSAPVGQYHYSGGQLSNGSRPSGFSPIAQRPSFYNRRPGYPGPNRYRRPYAPYYGIGIPYGVPVTGWDGSDYPGYFDSTGYDPSTGQPDDSGNSIDGYAQQATDQGPPPPYQEQPPAEQPSAEPQPAPAPPAAAPENEDAVTLVFKDGRPPEQIHNYALTRTTLYVRDQHRRDIPVDQLDLAATQKVNHDAGIDFHVPGAAQ